MTEVPLPETCCPATVWIRVGQAAYLGPSLRLDPHSGAVDCLVVGVDAPFTLHAGGTTHRARSAVIPARTRHQVVTEGRVLFCYLDPAARVHDRGPGIRLGHPDEDDLVRDPDPARVFDRLSPVRVDERIRAALRIMRAHPADRLSAAEVAREVHLSTSRFLHLFSAHTRTTFRRYRLWTRMVRVAAAVSAGHDLTRASADAGFASPAHFSDSFHAMFGLSAGKLLAAGARVVVAA
ncbi:helix-turn-helix transcriptional regulator [Actinophytocola sp. KF-1]